MDPVDDVKTIAEAGGTVLSGTSKFMDSLLKLRPGLAVASEARGVAHASSIMLDTIEETINRCRKMGLPQETTDAMCLRVANEFGRSENLSSCLSFAQDVVGDDFDASGIDHGWFLKWSGHASEQCDDEMRVIWGKLLAGELEQPGTYTKRAMSILSDMSRDEALVFSRLCSASIFANPQSNRSLVAVLRKDNAGGTYNDGLIKVEDLDTLSSLGLITTMTWPTQHLPGNQLGLIEVNGQILPMRNPSGEAKSIVFSQMRYLKEGLILSTLCEVGSYEHLPQIVDEVITASGLVNHL
ncbi:MAG TPA: DUF2806 domain-containing protein [Candidatus Olsenella pullicola]|nr:DUF2806 domain-containing protein [Candidatus Olsenella pullicola]